MIIEKNKVKSVLVAGNLIIGLSLAIHILNYIFTVIIGRMLLPVEFGEIATLWSIYAILTVPAGGLGLIIVKAVATGNDLVELKKESERLILYLILSSILGGIIISPFAISRLGIDSFSYIAIVITAALSYRFTFYQNIILGKEDFLRYNLASVISTLSKLIFGVILVYFGLSVFGASTSLLFASLVGLLYSAFVVKSRFYNVKAAAGAGAFDNGNLFNLKGILSLMYVNLLLILLISLDVIIANFYFGKDMGGLYASMSTISKIPLYISLAISGAMYPVYSRLHIEDSFKGKAYFKLYIFFVIICTVFASIFFYFCGNQFIKILFGFKYLDAGQYLYAGVIYYGAISFLYSYTQYSAAKSKFTLTKAFIISIIYILITYVFFSIFK